MPGADRETEKRVSEEKRETAMRSRWASREKEEAGVRQTVGTYCSTQTWRHTAYQRALLQADDVMEGYWPGSQKGSQSEAEVGTERKTDI